MMPKQGASELRLNAEKSGIPQSSFDGLYPNPNLNLNLRPGTIALFNDQKFIFLVTCFVLLINSSAIHIISEIAKTNYFVDASNI